MAYTYTPAKGDLALFAAYITWGFNVNAELQAPPRPVGPDSALVSRKQNNLYFQV